MFFIPAKKTKKKLTSKYKKNVFAHKKAQKDAFYPLLISKTDRFLHFSCYDIFY